jgi:hypothetical protein
MFTLYNINCMLVAHTFVLLKIIQYQFCSCKDNQSNCKQQLIAYNCIMIGCKR